MAPPAGDVFVRVTAGPSYDSSTHQVVQVNTDDAVHFESNICSASISVKIQNFRGIPLGLPKTHAYFSHSSHHKDQYSISFSLTPKKSLAGSRIVFGNDIDHPVRDKLPYGTSAAFKILKTVIDPGLDGDLYADKPHLYGCALSSYNTLWVGSKAEGKAEDKGVGAGEDGVIEEGGDEQGLKWREEKGAPMEASRRKNWYLGKGRADEWEWEQGRVYKGDFFNPYLDFNDFSLKLPGFSLSVLGYLGGEDYLRYVMKDKETGEILFVVVFTLVHREDAEKESQKIESGQSKSTAEQPAANKKPETSNDDVD